MLCQLSYEEFFEFTFTCDRNETWNEVDSNCGKFLDEMEMFISRLIPVTGND